MLRIRERILLAAFASVFAGTVGGWALLAALPSESPPRPAIAASALAYAADAVATETRERAAATAAPPAPTPSAPAIVIPERAAATDPAPTGREFRLKFENGTSASLDPENGRVQLRTPFGNLELKL